MRKYLLILLFAGYAIAAAAVKLPAVFSDNMVLQRNMPITVWGWCDKNKTVTAVFNGETKQVKADSKGRWELTFRAQPHGGPYQLTVSDAKGSVTLSNILVGDVWIGSGQSNMEWEVKNSKDAEKEIAAANYDKLRLFTVTRKMSFSPVEDVLSSGWQVCSSHTVGNFSAVAYFFGRKLMEDLDVPIGLINTSWGGTNIETWISWDVMKQDSTYKYLDLKELEKIPVNNAAKRKDFEEALKHDNGRWEKWYDPAFIPDGWKAMELPKPWSRTELAQDDGIVWFRREITLPADVESNGGLLSLGIIDDGDETYINGVQVGATNAYAPERRYSFKPGTLKPGKNVIVIRVIDTGGNGGLVGRSEQLFLEINGSKYPLNGEWLYKPAVRSTDFGIKDFGPNTYPSQLFNAMIAPIVKFKIAGAIWYQGEANVGNPQKYQALFPTLIQNWRSKWGYDFPFLWAQLANFMKPSNEPTESNWAALREAQTMTLEVPSTGQALAIDIGEADDIHPRNKQDVGLRLALAALKVAYKKDVIYSGPMFNSVTSEGNALRVSFRHTGSGLISKNDKYGYVRGFAIAGADGKFVWAKAYIDGNDVVVYSPSVKDPISIRYAWADNPDDANLFNAEGLPACPFRYTVR